MKIMKNLLVLFMVITTLSACSSDDDSINETPGVDLTGQFTGEISDALGWVDNITINVSNRTITTLSPKGAPANISLPTASSIAIKQDDTFTKTVNGIGVYTYTGGFTSENRIDGIWECRRNGQIFTGTFFAQK